MNLVLFGPPGAGKGTQSQHLIEKHSMTHVSTGDLLRAAVKAQTVLGQAAKKYIDAGNLVPDSLVIGLIQEVMAHNRGGMLFDGFPRTTAQGEALDNLLEAASTKIVKAVFLEVPRELLKTRLTGRRVCTSCGTTFNVAMHAPKVEGVCDACAGVLEHRADDRAEVIEHRLEVYEKNTAPLKDFYKKSKRFVSVDGVGDPAVVLARIEKAIIS